MLQKIGFSNLPLTMNAEHIKNMHRDTEHVLSRAFMEQLPELIKDPLAVIESKTSPESSTVMLLNAVVNGKPYIAPVYVTGTSVQNGVTIDSNNIATVFRKGNAITKLLTDALEKENAGNSLSKKVANRGLSVCRKTPSWPPLPANSATLVCGESAAAQGLGAPPL